MKITKGALPQWVREFVEASGYKGRKFEVEVRSTFTVPSDAGLWYGGTCEKFYSLSPDGSEAARLNNEAPWRECGRGETVSIPEGVLLARVEAEQVAGELRLESQSLRVQGIPAPQHLSEQRAAGERVLRDVWVHVPHRVVGELDLAAVPFLEVGVDFEDLVEVPALGRLVHQGATACGGTGHAEASYDQRDGVLDAAAERLQESLSDGRCSPSPGRRGLLEPVLEGAMKRRHLRQVGVRQASGGAVDEGLGQSTHVRILWEGKVPRRGRTGNPEIRVPRVAAPGSRRRVR